MNPIPSAYATGTPKRNPLASGPTIRSTFLSFKCSTILSIVYLNASPLEINVEISLKLMPSFGKP